LFDRLQYGTGYAQIAWADDRPAGRGARRPWASPRKTFYVDAGGRLRRHDYVPEVIGRWARAAHHCADHVQADGLLFPTRRWVHPLGPGSRSLPFPTLVSLQLTDLRVETE
jgi:hypothetical protein